MVIYLDRHQYYELLVIPRSKNRLLTSALSISGNSKTETKAVLNMRIRSTNRNYIF